MWPITNKTVWGITKNGLTCGFYYVRNIKRKKTVIDLVGLRQKDIEIIVSVIQTHPEVTEAYLFGSYAKGNFRTGSDVDLALKEGKLTAEIVSSISYQLNEETTLPYKFDVLNYNNKDLKEHIDRIGIPLSLIQPIA